MLPKIPRSRYTGKPVRRLRLPKIGPPKSKGFFEEYLYVLLGMVFVAATILGKAGGMSPYNSLVVGAWITAALWFASQWKGYLSEKEKAANGKALATAEAARAEAAKGPLPLPAGMKPMIGPQWPVRTGVWPASPGRLRQWPKPPADEQEPPPDPNKKVFVYERPTLPDRTPKLPNNWKKTDKKKPKR